jgi:hypothetical protein
VQTLCALYNYNCPTFLFNQKQWKVFVENTARDEIFTFPSRDGTYQGTSIASGMGADFVRAIVICLLSPRLARSNLPRLPAARTPIGTDRSVTVRPDHVSVEAKTAEPTEGVRRSTRLKRRLNSGGMAGTTQQEPITPRFISGYENGKPVYTKITVFSKRRGGGNGEGDCRGCVVVFVGSSC